MMDRRSFLQSAVAASALPLVIGKTASAFAHDTPTTTPTPTTTMTSTLKVVIAGDPFVLSFKDSLVAHLKGKGHEVVDVDNALPYYESAQVACNMLQNGTADRAILICGTGMGMSVIANRFKGVVASVVESVYAAGMCRTINNANALCLGAMIWGEMMAAEAVDVFLARQFTEGLEGLADYLRETEVKVEAIRP